MSLAASRGETEPAIRIALRPPQPPAPVPENPEPPATRKRARHTNLFDQGQEVSELQSSRVSAATGRIKCKYCDSTFLNSQTLARHVAKKHPRKLLRNPNEP
jgi:hypothetical protein